MYLPRLSKFDSICPFKLLVKLFKLGIDPRILRYLCAYFIGRTFKIKLGDFISQLFLLLKGCPQGSILSPLLFALFYNDVGSSLLFALFKLFADDLVFYIFHNNCSKLIEEAEKILASLHHWCTEQDLMINFSKTEYVIFHKSQNSIEEIIPELKCNGEIIQRVLCFKYLGVYFDSTFTFQRHFEHVLSKVASSVGCILQIKRHINLQTFKTLVNSFIYSHIDYCLPVWGNISQTHIKTLQTRINTLLASYFYPHLHNKFQRLNKIAHASNGLQIKQMSLDYNALYEHCNLLSIQERIKYFNAVIAFKAIYSRSITEISDIFRFGTSLRTQLLILPEHESKIYENSAYSHAIKTWNSLSKAAKEPNISLDKFKSLIDKWLVDERDSDFVSC